MADRPKRTVLFLGLADHDRSRAAEVLFNSAADRMGLPWVAMSRGLATDVGRKPRGPMRPETVKALEEKGIAGAALKRPPLQVDDEDFTTAARIVAVCRSECEALLRDRSNDVEFWQVAPGDVATIERDVMSLITRLLGGRTDVPETPKAKKPEPPKKVLTAKVGRETAGRKGKGVTTIFDANLNEVELRDLAAKLKQRCGTGGTVKEGRIEIQGDNRDRIVAELETMGFRVKKAGG